MLPKLTLKQRKFWKHYIEHHKLCDAAKYAGSKGKDTNSLSAIGYEILESLQLSMPELLNAEGLTDKLLAEKTLEGLSADRVQIATWEGKITDQKAFTDFATRAKYIELLGRMKGVFIDRHELTGKDGGEISITYAPSKIGKSNKGLSLDID